MKKIILIIIVAFMLPSTAFASGTGDDSTVTSNTPNSEQISVAHSKIELAQEHADSLTNDFGTMALGEMKTLALSTFEQETSYWCGPASTKQVLHFLNGSSSSQTFYAGELNTDDPDGTDFSVVDNVLNDFQTANTYVYQEFTSSDFLTWKSAMILTVDWGNPAVVDLSITAAYMPNYINPVAGHIISTSGYDAISDSNLRIRLTDPYDQGNRGDTIGNKWYTMSGVWSANQAHFRKAIIW